MTSKGKAADPMDKTELAEPELTAGQGAETPEVETTPAAIAKPTVGLHELSKAERSEFLKSGKTPDRKAEQPTSDVDAASSPAPSGDQSASTDAEVKAASETAKPSQKGKKPSTDDRWNELLEDRGRQRERADTNEKIIGKLEQRLAALETSAKQGAKPDSPAAADPSKDPRAYAKMEGYPKLNDFDGDVDEWGAAVTAFVAEQVTKRHLDAALSERDARTQQERTQAQELDRVIDRAAARLESEKTANPELATKVHPGFHKLQPARFLPDDQITPSNLIKDFVMFDAEHPLSLSVFFSTEEGQAEFRRLATSVLQGGMTLREMDRALALRDASFSSAPGGAKPTGTVKAGDAPRKSFSKAPEPPAQVRKEAGGGDAVERQVTSGNLSGFIQEMDAREGTQTRRFGRRKN